MPFQLWIIKLDEGTGDDEDVNIPPQLVPEPSGESGSPVITTLLSQLEASIMTSEQ